MYCDVIQTYGRYVHVCVLGMNIDNNIKNVYFQFDLNALKSKLSEKQVRYEIKKYYNKLNTHFENISFLFEASI